MSGNTYFKRRRFLRLSFLQIWVPVFQRRVLPLVTPPRLLGFGVVASGVVVGRLTSQHDVALLVLGRLHLHRALKRRREWLQNVGHRLVEPASIIAVEFRDIVQMNEFLQHIIFLETLS